MRADVLAVTGLGAEARIARGPGVRTVAGGGRALRLEHDLEREVECGVRAIVSFGIAGALAPALRPGAVAIATGVISGSGPGARWYATDARWTAALVERLPRAMTGPFAGSDVVVADRAAKEALAASTRAIAVDMESHVAARVASRHALPFAVVRTIVDPLDRIVPRAAMHAMRPDGSVDVAAVLRALALGPRELPDLLRIGRDARVALRALGRSRRLLGDDLGLPDLDQLLLDVV